METEKQAKPILSWFSQDIDIDDIDFEWDYLLEAIDEVIGEVNSDGYWFCEVENFGWRKQSGSVFLEFSTGKEMLCKVLPKTDCSFNIYQEGKILKIQNFHHDSPVGNEWYELTPISAEQFENQEL